MFDRLIDFLVSFADLFKPFCVLQPYEEGVIVRLGQFERKIGPGGFHWMWPFHIDQMWHDNVVPQTHQLAGMATTTVDGKGIGFDAIITYRITDIEKAILKVNAVKDAIADTCQGIIGTTLSEATWEDVLHGRATEALTEACRKKGWRWGIEILQVQLSGVCLVRNIRLSGSASQHSMDISHHV